MPANSPLWNSLCRDRREASTTLRKSGVPERSEGHHKRSKTTTFRSFSSLSEIRWLSRPMPSNRAPTQTYRDNRVPHKPEAMVYGMLLTFFAAGQDMFVV